MGGSEKMIQQIADGVEIDDSEASLGNQLRQIYGQERADNLIKLFGDVDTVVEKLPRYIDTSDSEQVGAVIQLMVATGASLASQKPKETQEIYLDRSERALQELVELRSIFRERNRRYFAECYSGETAAEYAHSKGRGMAIAQDRKYRGNSDF
jgi:hypothetical protein